jgi:tetratricopeptide (TPR) repeat protein
VLSPSLTPQSTRTIELTQTPFYPEKGYQYGPAALATVLGASGATTTPAQLTALVYLPSQDSSPQSQVQAAPQRFERLSYQVLPTLPALLAEVEAQRPVLVLLQNHAPSSAGTRYYAVLIGYNAQTDTVLLRSGTTRRQVMTARAFLVAWDNTERWAMLILRPGELPAMANRTHYLAAAAEFERGGRPENAMLVFDAALKYWPDEPLAWIGHATAQLHTGDLMAAARDYVTALRIDGSNAAGRNDLVMTLLDLGCLHKAQSQIARISLASLSEAQQAVIVATRDRVRSSARNLMAVEPPACAEFSY